MKQIFLHVGHSAIYNNPKTLGYLERETDEKVVALFDESEI